MNLPNLNFTWFLESIKMLNTKTTLFGILVLVKNVVLAYVQSIGAFAPMKSAARVTFTIT